MALTVHPSFPAPTIQEALCEIRFAPSETSVPFGEAAAALWDRVRGSLPLIEAHVDLVLPQSPATDLEQGRPRFVFRNPARPLWVQVMPDTFTVNVLAPYLGWATMREDVLENWKAFYDSFGPARITRLELRYINIAPLPVGLDKAEGMFKPGPFLAEALFDSQLPFLSRVQTHLSPGENLTATVGFQDQVEGVWTKTIVDIQRILLTGLETETDTLAHRLDAMHEDVWRTFASIKGPKWDAILEGGI